MLREGARGGRFPVRLAGLGGLLMIFVTALVCSRHVRAHRDVTSGPEQAVTRYAFADPLVVDDSLPVGTVIASLQVPEYGPGRMFSTPSSGGMWSMRGLRHRYLLARTDVNGVWVRVSPEKTTPREATLLSSSGWRTGGFRVELVKTGVIRNGVLRHVMDPLEYRVYGTRLGYRRLLLREQLRYDGPLRIRVRYDRDGAPVRTG